MRCALWRGISGSVVLACLHGLLSGTACQFVLVRSWWCRAPFDGDDAKTVVLAVAASVTESGHIWGWQDITMKTYIYPAAIEVTEIYYVDVDEPQQVLQAACLACTMAELAAAAAAAFVQHPTLRC